MSKIINIVMNTDMTTFVDDFLYKMYYDPNLFTKVQKIKKLAQILGKFFFASSFIFFRLSTNCCFDLNVYASKYPLVTISLF